MFTDSKFQRKLLIDKGVVRFIGKVSKNYKFKGFQKNYKNTSSYYWYFITGPYKWDL